MASVNHAAGGGCQLPGIRPCQPSIIKIKPSGGKWDIVVLLLLLPSPPRYQKETASVLGGTVGDRPDSVLSLTTSEMSDTSASTCKLHQTSRKDHQL